MHLEIIGNKKVAFVYRSKICALILTTFPLLRFSNVFINLRKYVKCLEKMENNYINNRVAMDRAICSKYLSINDIETQISKIAIFYFLGLRRAIAQH